MDLSKQQALNAELKKMHQINFTGKYRICREYNILYCQTSQRN